LQVRDYGLVAAALPSLQPASSSVGPEQVLGVVAELLFDGVLLSDGALAGDCGDGELLPLLELPPPPLPPLEPLARATLSVVIEGAT
jgi:hypothetical protein